MDSKIDIQIKVEVEQNTESKEDSKEDTKLVSGFIVMRRRGRPRKYDNSIVAKKSYNVKYFTNRLKTDNEFRLKHNKRCNDYYHKKKNRLKLEIPTTPVNTDNDSDLDDENHFIEKQECINCNKIGIYDHHCNSLIIK